MPVLLPRFCPCRTGSFSRPRPAALCCCTRNDYPVFSCNVGLTIVCVHHVSLLNGCVPPGHLPGQLLHQPEAKYPGEHRERACWLLLPADTFFFHLPEQKLSADEMDNSSSERKGTAGGPFVSDDERCLLAFRLLFPRDAPVVRVDADTTLHDSPGCLAGLW